MKLSIGIVGLPNVGKSTLFKTLTKNDILIANYPFATIDPNVGVVSVPDERLDKLAEMSKSEKIVPAIVEFWDIAGLVKGANSGEGLGNQFLSNIRETQVVCMVLRIFKDSTVVHVEESVDPMRDLSIISMELALKDMDTIEKRLHKAEKDARAGDKQAKLDVEILKTAREKLSRGEMLIELREEPVIKEMQLLTAKKQIYLLNGDPEEVPEGLIEELKKNGGEIVVANVALADDIPELIRAAYHALDLISFITTGEMETRAWTIRRGSLAPQAAGEIHGDFEKNFIRAEVVNWQDLLATGSWAKARESGKLRLEGKEYEVKDGDVMVIRHG
jgi:hypothetical protein